MIFMTTYFMYPCVYTASILPEISTFNCFSFQMGRKFRLSVSRKNEERKRWGFYLVRIPLSVVSVYQVSIPRDFFSFRITIPIEIFKAAAAGSLDCLRTRVSSCGSLPAGWIDATKQVAVSGELVFCRLETKQSTLTASFSLHVQDNFQWHLSVHGQQLQTMSCPLVEQLPSILKSIANIEQVLTLVNSAKVCEGNPDEKFRSFSVARKGRFMDATGINVVAAEEMTLSGHATIRHGKCEILIDSSQTRCLKCEAHRKGLHSLLSRIENGGNTDRSAPNSHVNYCFLSTPEKIDRLQRLHSLQRCMKLQLGRLERMLGQVIEEKGVVADDNIHHDLQEIMEENTPRITEAFPENSFERLFWEQQLKALQLKDGRSMRWHPLMIKWCLYLRHLSGKAYETLRASGCVKLPSQRTLRDYTHCVNATTGFSTAVDQQLMQVAEISKCPEWQKYVVLVIDEMYIKEDLVYDKNSGALIGFANLGEINSHLLQFQASVESDTSTSNEQLAKTMLVFMVRGLFSSLEFPYVQFPCTAISGDLLFDPLWQAIERIERCGLKVLAVTADGASPNRRLFKIHNPSRGSFTHKVPNPYSTDGRDLLFFSDPPHLLKTVRNCFASKSRALWCKGSEIKWKYVADLYYRRNGAQTDVPGIPCLTHKLKYEHIHLTSFSKMRVDLAAQVLSDSVSKALEMTGGKDAQETAKFVGMFDKFFDCLNVNSFIKGKHSRKAFQNPYRSATDFRLKWLEEEFIPYLDEWSKSVEEREGFSKLEKKHMLLSPETLLGIRITVKSFVELIRYIFTVPGVKVFLSEKISQDTLEKFFGCQRQRGAVNDNPNVQQFCYNTQALRTITSIRPDVKGNCRGLKRVHTIDWQKENVPLPKRQKPRKVVNSPVNLC